MRVNFGRAMHPNTVLAGSGTPNRKPQNLISRLIGPRLAVVCFGLMALSAAMVPTIAAAQDSAGTSSSAVMVVGNDQGGLVSSRVAEISRILSQGTHVEIRGQVCYSSCTMYLGMPDTCVMPQTSFGFHGPSHYGRQLSDRDFEYWSQVIASHYPAPLRSWYLTEGRTRISDYFRISGSELIRLGVRQCSAQSDA
jgi:hypothetical protein